MKKLYIALLAVAVITSSCSEEQESTTDAQNVTSEEGAVAPGGDANAAAASPAAATEIQAVPADQVPVNATPGNLSVNPAHGQPGHRCDIAVGAPLDGSAPANTAPKVSTQIQANTDGSINVAAPASAPAGANLNPAHGQPGHDCSVAVGAPLPAK